MRPSFATENSWKRLLSRFQAVALTQPAQVTRFMRAFFMAYYKVKKLRGASKWDAPSRPWGAEH